MFDQVFVFHVLLDIRFPEIGVIPTVCGLLPSADQEDSGSGF
jgi:hypothetical protein